MCPICKIFRRDWQRASFVATLSGFSVVCLGDSLSPGAALAQTVTLPDVNVIGTTPLSTPSRTRRRAGPTVTTPTVSTAPEPALEPVASPDITGIDRDKVPSNTETLVPADFDHSKSSNVPE